MKPFNREKFLLYMLAGLLAWQAAIFSYGVVLCSRVTPQTNVTLVCPEIGSRFDKFVQTTLGAVLGLLAGAAALSTNQRPRSSDDDRDASASPRPLQLQQPFPESSSASDLPQSERGASSSRQESAPSSRKRNHQS